MPGLPSTSVCKVAAVADVTIAPVHILRAILTYSVNAILFSIKPGVWKGTHISAKQHVIGSRFFHVYKNKGSIAAAHAL